MRRWDQRLLAFFVGDARAAVGNLIAAVDVEVELVRLTTTGGVSDGGIPRVRTNANGSYRFELPANTIQFGTTWAVRMVPPVANGQALRSPVYGAQVNLSPESEAVTQLLFERQNVVSSNAALANVTAAEVQALLDTADMITSTEGLRGGNNDTRQAVLDVKAAMLQIPAVRDSIDSVFAPAESFRGPGDFAGYFPLQFTTTARWIYDVREGANGVVQPLALTRQFEGVVNGGTQIREATSSTQSTVLTYRSVNSGIVLGGAPDRRILQFPLRIGAPFETAPARRNVTENIIGAASSPPEQVSFDPETTKLLRYEAFTVPDTQRTVTAIVLESVQSATASAAGANGQPVNVTILRTETNTYGKGIGLVRQRIETTYTPSVPGATNTDITRTLSTFAAQ